MSKQMRSEEVDKQLKEAFSAYVVEPMDSDIREQLSQWQKKWFGNEENFDSDIPYLETLVDGCVQRLANKLDSMSKNMGEQLKLTSSSLKDILDDIEELDSIESAVGDVAKKVQVAQTNIALVEEGQAKSFEQVECRLQKTNEVVKTEAERVLQAVSLTAEATLVNVKSYTETALKQLNSDISAYSKQTEENYLALREDSTALISRLAELLKKIDQMHQTTTTLKALLEHLVEKQDIHQRNWLEIEKKLTKEKEKAKKILYVILALNGAGVVTMFALLLVMLFG